MRNFLAQKTSKSILKNNRKCNYIIRDGFSWFLVFDKTSLIELCFLLKNYYTMSPYWKSNRRELTDAGNQISDGHKMRQRIASTTAKPLLNLVPNHVKSKSPPVFLGGSARIQGTFLTTTIRVCRSLTRTKTSGARSWARRSASMSMWSIRRVCRPRCADCRRMSASATRTR